MKTYIMLISLFLLTACARKTQYYLLPVNAPPAATQLTQIQNKHIYALRYLKLPDYLTDRFIIYFNADGSVNRDAKRRWVNYPDDNIRRLLALQLRTRLNSNEFYTYPLPNDIRAEHIIDIEISEMIADSATNSFHATATWQISHQNNQQPYQFRREYSLLNLDTKTLVNQYEKALNDLSAEIATTLQ